TKVAVAVEIADDPLADRSRRLILRLLAKLRAEMLGESGGAADDPIEDAVIGVAHFTLEGPSGQIPSEAPVQMVEQPRRVIVRLLFERRVVGERFGDFVAQFQAGPRQDAHELEHLGRHAQVERGRDPMAQLEPHPILPGAPRSTLGALLVTEWIVPGWAS